MRVWQTALTGAFFLATAAGAITAKVTTLDLALAELPTRAQWEEKAKRMDAIGHHARVTLAKLDKGEKLPTKISYPVQTWAFGTMPARHRSPATRASPASSRRIRCCQRVSPLCPQP